MGVFFTISPLLAILALDAALPNYTSSFCQPLIYSSNDPSYFLPPYLLPVSFCQPIMHPASSRLSTQALPIESYLHWLEIEYLDPLILSVGILSSTQLYVVSFDSHCHPIEIFSLLSQVFQWFSSAATMNS